MSEKADWVRVQPQVRRHTCHWPGCDLQVPPAMWGCRGHWFQLPTKLRDEIWTVYTIGQEHDASLVSQEYRDVADWVQAWIRENRVDRSRP